MADSLSLKDKIVLFLIFCFLLLHIVGGLVEAIFLFATGLIWVIIPVSFALIAFSYILFQVYAFFMPNVKF